MKPDALEDAWELEEQERLAGLAKAREQSPVPHEFDGSHCTDCGNEIPRLRLEAGRFRCTECQTALEKRSKLFRK